MATIHQHFFSHENAQPSPGLRTTQFKPAVSITPDRQATIGRLKNKLNLPTVLPESDPS